MNGAVVNVRHKGDKLAVWLAAADQDTAIINIGKLVKKRLGLEDKITFNIHGEEKTGKYGAGRGKLTV